LSGRVNQRRELDGRRDQRVRWRSSAS